MAIDLTVIEALLAQETLSRDDIRVLQRGLASQGFTANSSQYGADGYLGPKTASDLKGFLDANAKLANNIHPNLLSKINQLYNGVTVRIDFNTASPMQHNKALDTNLIDNIKSTHPDRVQYIDSLSGIITKHNAELGAGMIKLDADMLLSQMAAESAFDPNAEGADEKSFGIAQFTVETAAEYGLSLEELKDPEKSMKAFVEHMSNLTQEFGDQRLAMAAYNGGRGAIDYVAREKHNGKRYAVTFDSWKSFMEERRASYREENGVVANAWHETTLGYILKILFGTEEMVTTAQFNHHAAPQAEEDKLLVNQELIQQSTLGYTT